MFLAAAQVGDLVVHRIGPGGLSAVSCHLVQRGQEAVLIDSGFILHHRLLYRCLRRLSLPLSAVRAVLQTHGHLDHLGRLHEIKTATKAPAYLHPEERLRQQGRFAYRGWSRVCGWLEAIGRPLIGYRVAEIEHALRPGQLLDLLGGIRVVHLPGHTEGHCGFWFADQRLLFAGDLIATFGMRPHLSPRIFNSATARYPEAFRRVLMLDPEHVVLNHYWRLNPRRQAAALRRFAVQYLDRKT